MMVQLDFTPEIEILYMLFERSHTNRMHTHSISVVNSVEPPVDLTPSILAFRLG